MRAGFRFEPGRFGRHKHRHEEAAPAESQPNRAPVPPRGPAPDHQAPLREQTRGAHPSLDSWERCTFAKWTGSGTVGGAEAPEDPGIDGAEGVSDRNVSNPPVRTDTGTNDGDRRPSLVEENGVCGKFRDRTPGNSDASGTSPEASGQEDQAGAGELTETCQRVRVHFRKTLFSCARTDIPWPLRSHGSTRTHAEAPACPAPPAGALDAASSPISTNKQRSPGGRQWTNRQAGECTDAVLTGVNEQRQGDASAHSPDSTNALDPLLAEEARPAPPLDGTRESSPSPQAGHQPERPGSSPPPLESDMERTSSLYSISPPLLFPPGGVERVSLAGASSPCSTAKPLEKQWSFSEDTRTTSRSSSSAPANSCDSFYSSESSLLLPQVAGDGDEDPLSCPTTLLPNYTDEETLCSLFYQTYGQAGRAFPPMLSPVTSPHWNFCGSLLSSSPGSPDREEKEEEEEEEEDTCSHKSPRLDDGGGGGGSVDLQGDLEGSGEVSEPAFPTEPQFSPSGQNGAGRSRSSDERDQTCHKASSDDLDEVTAYKQDILLVDVTQDDAELFENLPQKSLLRLGPVRVSEELKPIRIPRKHNGGGAPVEFDQRSTPVVTNYRYDSADDTEESNKRPWRPQSSSHSRAPSGSETLKELTGPRDANNNQANRSSERTQPTKTLNPTHNPAAPSAKNGPCVPNSANSSEFRRQKSNCYCWKYFSEFTTCGFQLCRFQHVPLEGDEKFCIETISRFSKNPMCLYKARAVFTGYYLHNPPGAFFSMPILLSLLWALLKSSMLTEIFSVLDTSVAHKIVPGHDFVLALFNHVREKGHMGLAPELMQLTFKMAAAGLVLNFDWMDGLRNNGEILPGGANSNSGKGAGSAPCLGYPNVAHAVVEIELCAKLEDWKHMGDVFASLSHSIQRPNQLEQISGHVAIALLSEGKDKQAVPFAAFAETVCQKKQQGHLTMSYLGRIGVSLMLRYHKTQQWAKGRKVAEVLSLSKVNYSIQKGLFGNEDRASRCSLVTVATELFLLSGSIEGALNTLRENSWFLSSSSWPCEPADLEGRTRVLLQLAKKTSHRGTLEILCNLPGLKEPNDSVNISSYGSVFNAHLLVCVDRQTLPVASDLVDFMLAKHLAVEPALLQALLQKLGRQNLWLRARELFRYSLSRGYYQGVSAPPGFMALMVPCRLGEVELALAFEMFVTVNGSVILHAAENAASSLSITLKRTQSGESEYLSAGSRLLSAASIPQPKLTIHYTAVNSSQEQVFTLDTSSARSWLRHNHLWANEVWAH